MDFWEALEIIGEALVIVGVVGEVFADWPDGEKLAKASSLVLIIGLGVSLGALIQTNEGFNGKIADLNLQASKATELAAANEKEAATQRARADKDEKDLLQLQHASLPREIDEKRLATSMRNFPGVHFLVFTIGDFEPSHLSGLIEDSLSEASWTYNGGGGGSVGQPEFSKTGVWIEAAPFPKSGEWKNLSDRALAAKHSHLEYVALALRDSLRDQGIKADTRPFPKEAAFPFEGQDGTIHIFVSIKPFPGMPDNLLPLSHDR